VRFMVAARMRRLALAGRAAGGQNERCGRWRVPRCERTKELAFELLADGS